MSLKNHFYITLPSSSCLDLYPDNKVTNYTTNLPNLIALDSDFEVALVELQLRGNIIKSYKSQIHEIFIYSDICCYTNIGTKISPILRVVPVEI